MLASEATGIDPAKGLPTPVLAQVLGPSPCRGQRGNAELQRGFGLDAAAVAG